jgi:hypothetical protein
MARREYAESLGLTVPQSIMLRADEVIEWRFRSAKQLDGRRPQWVIGFLGGRISDGPHHSK